MNSLETLMYQVSGFFLTPVLLAIVALFIYTVFVLGDFISQWVIRKRNAIRYLESIDGLKHKYNSNSGIPNVKTPKVKGYDLFNFASNQKSYTEDTLSVFALKNLETLRIVTRIAPMLGLVATMIPMGPALKSLANGNIQGISENLVVAFSAVIFGLIIASVTFWMAAVKKRWLADEMVHLMPLTSVMNTSGEKQST